MTNPDIYRSSSQSALGRFKEYLPDRPYCSGDKRVRNVCSKMHAIAYPYIQINFPRIRYLAFDLDYPYAGSASATQYIPRPTLTIVNNGNGHAHVLYELLDPIPRKRSSGSTRKLLKNVVDTYRKILCADKCITTQKQLVKNPLHCVWKVIANDRHIYELRELADYIPDEYRYISIMNRKSREVTDGNRDSSVDINSRHCTLFNYGRHYAYSIVHECSTEDELHRRVLEYIEHLNNTEIIRYFPAKGMLPYSSLRDIVSRIASWTYDRIHMFRDIRVGAMGFPSMKGKFWTPDEYRAELKYRQSQAAHRTNRMQREATRRQIREAVERCRAEGATPNISLIARMIDRPRKTVEYHRNMILESEGA